MIYYILNGKWEYHSKKLYDNIQSYDIIKSEFESEVKDLEPFLAELVNNPKVPKFTLYLLEA